MSTYEISKSSLLSLRAEILRKQDEVGKAKTKNNVKWKKIQKNTHLELKNKGVEDRSKYDLTEEEENLLEKSKTVLEAKSILYDKLANGSQNDLSEEEVKRYLVQFRKKKPSKLGDVCPESDSEDDVDNYPEDSEEETYNEKDYKDQEADAGNQWVEYIDFLGRTRECLRKDLEHFKSSDANLRREVDAKEAAPKPNEVVEEEPIAASETKSEISDIGSELVSEDMERDLQRQKWEREELELMNKTNVHYQDILFGEARSHGVGYYSFSKDEGERSKQQKNLQNLRMHTEKQQKRSQELRMAREKQLAARVRGAQNRKRARLGLPPEEEPTHDELKDQEAERERLRKEAKIEEERKSREEYEKLVDSARQRHVRPWDVGKEKAIQKHYEYSQEEWVAKKRKERANEFAPPSNYRTDFRSLTAFSEPKDDRDKSLNFTSNKLKRGSINPYKQNSGEATEKVARKRAEIPPPAIFDYYTAAGSSKHGNKFGENIEESIEAGLQFLRKEAEKKSRQGT